MALHRGGLLDETTHRLLAVWAADCAEHVLPLFASVYPHDDRPLLALESCELGRLARLPLPKPARPLSPHMPPLVMRLTRLRAR